MEAMLFGLEPAYYLRDLVHPKDFVYSEVINIVLNIHKRHGALGARFNAAAASAVGAGIGVGSGGGGRGGNHRQRGQHKGRHNGHGGVEGG
jgi:hypothetical protein